MPTVFGKIVRKEVPAKIVYEDDRCLAFYDVAPQAPVHVVFIPKVRIESLAELNPSDQELMGWMMVKIPEIAKKLGIEKNGFRVVTNIGNEGGQSVPHLHFHILGGRPLGWPPG